MPEMLDIVDENGVPTGQSVPRTTAHAEGLRPQAALGAKTEAVSGPAR